MKYISIDMINKGLAQIENTTILSSWIKFKNLINTLTYDKSTINLPNCSLCKYALTRYDGSVKYCENGYRARQLESIPNAPMAICEYYEEV